MALTKEFSRRLNRLFYAIEIALDENTSKKDLMPALFSVFSYIWSQKSNKLEKNE